MKLDEPRLIVDFAISGQENCDFDDSSRMKTDTV